MRALRITIIVHLKNAEMIHKVKQQPPFLDTLFLGMIYKSMPLTWAKAFPYLSVRILRVYIKKKSALNGVPLEHVIEEE